MALYAGGVRSITPSTTDDNWTVRAGASKSCTLKEFTFSGEATTSTAMHTRVARSSGQTGSATAGNVEKLHPNSPANGCGFSTTFGTTQPTLESGDLFSSSWNCHGGVVRWLAAPEERLTLIGATTELCVSCRNSVGTGTSSYHVIWEED
jgi:hypothetical protein